MANRTRLVAVTALCLAAAAAAVWYFQGGAEQLAALNGQPARPSEEPVNPPKVEDLQPDAASHPATPSAPDASSAAEPAAEPAAETLPATADPTAPAAAAPAATPPTAPSSAPGDGQAEADPQTEPAPANGPWDATLAEPTPWRQVAFETFDVARSIPSVEDLGTWLARVPGAAGNLRQAYARRARRGRLTGIMRLQAPWAEGRVLKVSLDNYNGLSLHFYAGQQGVTFTYYQNEKDRWAAYQTRRNGREPLPQHYWLAATDQGRCHRTELRLGGPLIVFYRQGQLALARGDVLLAAAPLARPPSDVYFHGQADFQGLAMLQCDELPNLLPAPRLEGATGAPPAELAWDRKPLGKGATFTAQEDGSISLIADQTSESGSADWKLPDFDAPTEILLELSEAAPGAGIAFKRDNGQFHEIVRYIRNSTSRRTILNVCGTDNVTEKKWSFAWESVEAAVEGKHWVRLLFGCGQLRWWVSVDGVNWAHSELPWRGIPGDIAKLSLHHTAKTPGARLRIHRVATRPLPGLRTLVADDLRRVSVAVTDAADLPAWRNQIEPQCPPQVAPRDWRLACALRSLARGCPTKLADPLLDLVLDEGLAERPLADQLAALDDAAQLQNLVDNFALVEAYFQRYDRLVDDAPQGLADRADAIRAAQLRVPLISGGNLAGPIAKSRSTRDQLISLAHQARWQTLQEICQELRFYHLDAQNPLVTWAETMARREHQGGGGLQAGGDGSAWRHPLVETVDKETFNAVAELQAVLDSQAFDDAAQLATSWDPASVSGLAPVDTSSRLLVSLPGAISLALEQHPQLRAAIQQRFNDLASLRVQRAIDAGDQRSLQMIAAQFEGCPAVAQAYQWLGDRALLNGWFRQAAAYFQQGAEQFGDTPLGRGLRQRQRLAAAMGGQSVGEPARESIRIGQQEFTAEEFERLVQQMLSRSASGQSPSAPPVPPAPGEGLAVTVAATIEEPYGRDPQFEMTRFVNRELVDWAGRQLGAQVDGEQLLVNNRFHVAAYQLPSGKLRWQTAPPEDARPMRSQDWSLIRMAPVLAGDAVLARQLYGFGPRLLSLDRTSGKTNWICSPANHYFVSDPLWLQERIFALAVVRGQETTSDLKLLRIDPANGEVLESTDLLSLRFTWWNRRVCEVAATADALLIAVGGATVNCDLAGNIRWIRRHVVLPATADPTWVRQSFQPPLVTEDGLLIVAQPGVRAVDCLRAATGKLLWSSVIPDLERIIGRSDQRLLLQSQHEIQCRRLSDGSLLWRQPRATPLLEAAAVTQDHLLLVTAASQDTRAVPQLVWHDLQSGEPRERLPLADMPLADPKIGPLVIADNQLITFRGSGQADPKRELLLLRRP